MENKIYTLVSELNDVIRESEKEEIKRNYLECLYELNERMLPLSTNKHKPVYRRLQEMSQGADLDIDIKRNKHSTVTWARPRTVNICLPIEYDYTHIKNHFTVLEDRVMHIFAPCNNYTPLYKPIQHGKNQKLVEIRHLYPHEQDS